MIFWLVVAAVLAVVLAAGWRYDRGRRRIATDAEFDAQRRHLRSDQGKGGEYGLGGSGPSDASGIGGP